MRLTIQAAVSLAVLILAASVRITDLCKFPLNNDEIAEVSWARRPAKEMIDLVKRDKVHPPSITEFSTS